MLAIQDRIRIEQYAQSEKPSKSLLNWVGLLVVAACALVIGLMAARVGYGFIPVQDVFYQADTERVLSNLNGHAENYYRLKVHPLYGWVCIFYQYILSHRFHIPDVFAIPTISVTIGAICAALLFAVMRTFAVRPLSAIAFTFLFCTSATFIFWSSVPETHMLGGASVLISILIISRHGRLQRHRRAVSAIAFAASFSMVVTDSVIWILQGLDYSPLLQGKVKEFWGACRQSAPSLFRTFLSGVLIAFVLWAPQYIFLGKQIGIPFNFVEERRYLQIATDSSVWSVHIFGLVSPASPLAVPLGLICVNFCIAAIALMPVKYWFLPLFTLFGFVLHLIYGGDSAFLFSPNYFPIFVLVLAIVVDRHLPQIPSAIVTLVIGFMLLNHNLEMWGHSFHDLAAAHKLIRL